MALPCRMVGGRVFVHSRNVVERDRRGVSNTPAHACEPVYGATHLNGGNGLLANVIERFLQVTLLVALIRAVYPPAVEAGEPEKHSGGLCLRP